MDANIRVLILKSWAVSWPMTIVMFFIFFMGLSDVYVAGRISKEIQAAYGLTSQLYFIFGIVAMAFTVGTVSVAARLFTSGNKKGLEVAVHSSLMATLACGAVSGLTGFLFSKQIIMGFHVPDQIKGYAIPLMRLYSVGIVFNYLLVVSNGILRASGRIRISLLSMGVVCVLNVMLNFALAFGMGLGYRGIAVATIISTAVGCGINLLAMRTFVRGALAVSWETIKRIAHIGWPAGLLQVFWQLGAVALYMILSLLPANKVEIMAAFTNGLKIESAIFLPAFAFNMANAVVVGNLLGARDKANAFRAGLVTAVLGVAVVSILTACVLFNARRIAPFLSLNDMVVSQSLRYLYIALLSEPVMAWGVILGGGLNGAGDTRGVMVISALSVWLVRIPLSFLLAIHWGWGVSAVWWSMNASILVQTILVTRRYLRKKWLDEPGEPGALPLGAWKKSWLTNL